MEVRKIHRCSTVLNAARIGCLKCLERIIITEGKNPNLKDDNRRTALHYSSYYKHNQCVQFLLMNGIDPNQ